MNKKIIFIILLTVFCLDFTREALADPPSWAPAHGHRHKKHHHHDDDDDRKDKRRYKEKKYKAHKVKKYKYVYYPEQEVYYYPVTRRYYWKEPKGWSVGVKLPGNISLGASSVPLELDTDIPYTRHTDIQIKYRN